MDIDKSKENIQPLRGGRNLQQLETALHAQVDLDAQRTLQAQKDEHEAAIRNYSGPDPLDPWFNYIQWIEQCFPKHGHEGHIDKVITECLQIFEKDERYYQDRRFVKLWIKYIDCLANPLEIYQRLYNSGIGVECSELYRAWACYCEESGDYKKANQVFMLGIQARAQPFDELEQAHKDFQLFFAQRMLHDDSPTKRKAASALAETRMALTSLKSFKRRNIAQVPSQRTGENVRSVVPGTIRQAGTSQKGSNVMVNVYEDAPSTSQSVPTAENQGPASLLQNVANMENEKEVGMWTSAKVKMVHSAIATHQPLPFTPYEDEDWIYTPNHKQYCEDDLTEYVVPLSVPEPPDASKIICYNKEKVYVENTEFSLEEIKALKYKRTKVTEEKRPEQTLNTSYKPKLSYVAQEEAASNISALETLANCALEQDYTNKEPLIPLNIMTHQNITKVHHIHSPGEPKVLVNLDSKEFSQLANPSFRKNDENQHFTESDKKSVSDFGDDNKFTEDFNRSLVRNLHTDSITVNTKEARWELRNLFTDNAEPSIVQPLVENFDVPKFDIHEDRTMTMALNIKKNLIASPEVPEDKENENKMFSVPKAPQNMNKTTYYEEPSCTQVFNFNIKNSSTPNASQFKKPISYAEKTPNVRKFQIDDGLMDVQGNIEMSTEKREEMSRNDLMSEQQGVKENQQNGLSVIMETTREFNSKSSASSGSSGMQSTRTILPGYTTQDGQPPCTERSNYDSMYSHHTDPTSSKRSSMCNQPRSANGQFAKSFTPKTQPIPEHKVISPQTYAHDHQYQKPVQYNGYPTQRTMQVHGYQQNYNMYPQSQNYGSPQIAQQNYQVQQSYQSPNYHQSPHHPGMQSPHHQGLQNSGPQHQGMQNSASQHPGMQNSVSQHPGMQNSASQHLGMQSPASQHAGMQSPAHQPGFQSPAPQPGFQSPQYQMGYQSPVQNVQSSPQYPTRQEYQHDYSQGSHRPHTYAQSPNFQSPPHQNQYPNVHFQRNSNSYSQNGYVQQSYVHDPYNQNPYTGANHSFHSQNYAHQTSYRQTPKQVDHQYSYSNTNANQMPFQVYQSPSADHSYHTTNPALSPNISGRTQPMQTSPNEGYMKQDQRNLQQQSYKQNLEQVADQRSQLAPQKESHSVNVPAAKVPVSQPIPYKSPTSLLRSIRHEQPHAKPGPGTPDAGFSSQFLNFITSRNEPKDNANTPKFSNSPNISQKMHKNLYVSSPEQGQIPPSTSDSDSKESFTAQTAPSIQSAKTNVVDKQKDLSKRQLDFEHRFGYQSEDSRDSVSKESRLSSVHSRQSVHSEGIGMDVDSENSMDCAPYKSTHSISMIETEEIPRPADIDFPEIIDPFNKKILSSLLEYVKFPNKTHADGYIEVRSVPKLQTSTLVSVANYKFSVEKQLGKGNYGAVFSCLDLVNNKSVALKYQKPSRPWEFYICQEIKARIKDPFMLSGYMDIETAFLGENASIFVSELSKYGSLLDVANKVRVATSKCINELIVLLLTSEMLSIVHFLHKAEIIHADIKPDNFLLMKIPTQTWRTPSLQLIDLGCSIDMSLFPDGTTFREMISTEGFTCTEMREGKPWTYQTDFYCLAGTIHVILMGSYMKVVNKMGQWNIDKKLPRYMKVSLWDKIFTSLLNVPDCNNLPDLMDLKQEVEMMLSSSGVDDTLASQLRSFANVLKSR